jgi:hypothetical protein
MPKDHIITQLAILNSQKHQCWLFVSLSLKYALTVIKPMNLGLDLADLLYFSWILVLLVSKPNSVEDGVSVLEKEHKLVHVVDGLLVARTSSHDVH